MKDDKKNLKRKLTFFKQRWKIMNKTNLIFQNQPQNSLLLNEQEQENLSE